MNISLIKPWQSTTTTGVSLIHAKDSGINVNEPVQEEEEEGEGGERKSTVSRLRNIFKSIFSTSSSPASSDKVRF